MTEDWYGNISGDQEFDIFDDNVIVKDVNKDETNSVKLVAICKAWAGRQSAATKSNEVGHVEWKQVGKVFINGSFKSS